MRLFLSSLSVACFLFFSSRLVAQTSGVASYDYANAVADNNEPRFMDGIYMDAHNRKTTIKNIVHTPDANGFQDADIQEKKFTVINNQIVLVNADPHAKTDSSVAAVKELKPAELVEVTTEKATENKVSPTPLTVTEITTEDPAQPADEEVVEPVISKYAEMISVDPTEITNYPLYRFIDDWYGTRYKWGGTGKSGIDCSAFTQKLYKTVYGAYIARTAHEQHQGSERIRHYDEANEGDLIFFRIHHLRVSHVGIYLANGYFVHASRSQGVVISSMDTKYWRRRYAGCGKIERVEKPSESDFIQ